MNIIPSVTIVLDTEIRDAIDPADAANTYAHQAARLHAALYNSLPGGVYDRLLVLMLDRTASLLRVRHPPRITDEEWETRYLKRYEELETE
jgi:hypothetical protein